MSKALMEVLSGAIRINNLNKGKRGGTFIQFIINEDMIPVKIDDRGWVEKTIPFLVRLKECGMFVGYKFEADMALKKTLLEQWTLFISFPRLIFWKG
ncbi:hypothetical protein ACFL3M_03310, partial [Patescibacteria group bacterium]